MTRLLALAAVVLSLGAATVQADPLKDSIRTQGHITTHGLWDAR